MENAIKGAQMCINTSSGKGPDEDFHHSKFSFLFRKKAMQKQMG